MATKIADLSPYPKLHKEAIKCLDDQVSVSDAFDWNNTPQGHEFWAHLNSGRFSKAKELHPELFDEEPTLENHSSEFIDDLQSILKKFESEMIAIDRKQKTELLTEVGLLQSKIEEYEYILKENELGRLIQD